MQKKKRASGQGGQDEDQNQEEEEESESSSESSSEGEDDDDEEEEEGTTLDLNVCPNDCSRELFDSVSLLFLLRLPIPPHRFSILRLGGKPWIFIILSIRRLYGVSLVRP